jgi:dolichol-phosphate mannosyltransferase
MSSCRRFPSSDSLTMIVPVLNEADTIGELLKELDKRYPGLSVFVVDDGSTDSTAEVVHNSARICNDLTVVFISRADAEYKGITASVLDGLTRVTTEFVGVMDGDLQHPPAVLGDMMAWLFKADIVVGARIPYKENQGWHRIFVTRVATKLAHCALRLRGIRVSDPMSGFFMGRTALIAAVARERIEHFEQRGYKVLFDLLMQLPREAKINQHLYQFALREHGSSKLRMRHALYFLRSLFREVFTFSSNHIDSCLLDSEVITDT